MHHCFMNYMYDLVWILLLRVVLQSSRLLLAYYVVFWSMI